MNTGDSLRLVLDDTHSRQVVVVLVNTSAIGEREFLLEHTDVFACATRGVSGVIGSTGEDLPSANMFPRA